MITLLIVLIGISALLILSILIQIQRRSIDSTFGGQGSKPTFGSPSSTDFIEKLTWGLIVLFIFMHYHGYVY